MLLLDYDVIEIIKKIMIAEIKNLVFQLSANKLMWDQNESDTLLLEPYAICRLGL